MLFVRDSFSSSSHLKGDFHTVASSDHTQHMHIRTLTHMIIYRYRHPCSELCLDSTPEFFPCTARQHCTAAAAFGGSVDVVKMLLKDFCSSLDEMDG